MVIFARDVRLLRKKVILMNRETAIVLILFFLSLFGCGSGGGGDIVPPVIAPPVITPAPAPMVNGIWFACIDVDNEQVCNAPFDPAGFFNSGDVQITGNESRRRPHSWLDPFLQATPAGGGLCIPVSFMNIRPH